MPSRLALGNRTNASARLLALFWVILRLSCIRTSEAHHLAATVAIRLFYLKSDFAADARACAFACERGGAQNPPPRLRIHRLWIRRACSVRAGLWKSCSVALP